MGQADYYKDGSWNARCDTCGEKFKAEDLLLQWDNQRVCRDCLDPRHPQDLIRPPKAERPVPWSRPSPPPIWEVPLDTSNHILDGMMLDQITCG